MTPREFSAILSAVLVTAGTVWYIYLAIRGEKVRPVLATWIVFSGTMTLSFATYWTSPKHSLVSNASNAASVVSAVGIFITVAWLNGFRRISFSSFQKFCLAISSAIAIFWVVIVWGFKGTGMIPNILTQILMIIGYLVTAEKLWKATKNTESLFMWSCIAIGGVVALYTGIVSDDILATIFAARSLLAASTLVWLMYRAECRSRLNT